MTFEDAQGDMRRALAGRMVLTGDAVDHRGSLPHVPNAVRPSAYYVLGASLAVAGMALAMAGMPMVAGAMTGSVIENVFGGIIFSRARTHAP